MFKIFKLLMLVLTLQLVAFTHANHTKTPQGSDAASMYTSLKDADCKQLSEGKASLYHAACQAHAGYRLEVIGADIRYGADLFWKNTKISYQPDLPFHVGDVAEWRYKFLDQKKVFHALIYRVFRAQINPKSDALDFLPRTQDKQELIVIRLDKEHSCILGSIQQSKQMNQKARQLADDAQASCLPIQ